MSSTEYHNWRKASYSNGSGSCVEAASGDGTIAVRDTTDRDAGMLTFTPDAWRAFLRTLR
jgi:Domain of unknown function (DUF397)